MEKKLRVFFTTIVTHINTATLSIFSNPNTTSKQPFIFLFFLSLEYIHFYVSYSPTHYLLPSIISSFPFFSSLRLSRSVVSSPSFLSLVAYCGHFRRGLDALRGSPTLAV